MGRKIRIVEITEAVNELAFGEVLLKVRNGQVYEFKQTGTKYPVEALHWKFYK